ncbi:MAG TPA: nucleoside triphosphate pyrophosphohydrolase, partial [Vicinamibacterales bacterium]|nr:nucleoside triphosphate pyrophosphohydrolase [Vicinamibacterales bacterium]
MSDTVRAAAEFTRLVEIMATLRGPEGCPWDREQTIDTLKPFVLEETYEVLEAIDHHDHAALCEELGDFVFEAVFLAQLEAEANHFTIADSLKSIADKLVRRHPHVFKRDEGEAALENAGQVRVKWEEIKSQERGAKPKTLLSGIAPALPALLRAYHIGVRAASVGFDWSKTRDVVDKIQEEVDELREVVESPGRDQERAEEEMGDLLFS